MWHIIPSIVTASQVIFFPSIIVGRRWAERQEDGDIVNGEHDASGQSAAFLDL
jgi:hypothetical protein